EKRACLIVPDCVELRPVHTEPGGAFRRVGHAVPAPGCSARHVGDESLELAVDLAARVPDRGGELGKTFRQLGVALHDDQAVGNESHAAAKSRELVLQLGRMLRREGSETWRRPCTVHEVLLFVSIARYASPRAGIFRSMTTSIPRSI